MKKLTFLTALLLATTTFAQVPNYIPTNGLVSWWPFNGNANDESGNGNNGTVNGATLTSDRFGNSNKSYFFDGLTNRIEINLNSINNIFPASTESTSSIWIKSSDLNGPLISMQGDNGIEYDFHIGTLADIVQNPGYYGILVRDNCCGTGNNAFASNCIDNNWHMLTIVRLTDGSLKFYKDAVFEFTSVGGQNGILTFNPNYMTLGANYSWVMGSQNGCMSCNSIDQQHYNGALDDIGIWNRALTESEIVTLYLGCNLSITNQPQNQSVTTSVGTANFSVSSTSTNPIYQWQTNLGLGFQNLSNAGQYSGVTSSTLSVSNLSMTNNNQVFRCILNDSGCTDTTTTATLTIIDDASISETGFPLISISPNPTASDFTIVGLELYNNIRTMRVSDVNGKLVKELDPTASKFTLGSVKPGVYFLTITAGDKQEVIKIIKE